MKAAAAAARRLAAAAQGLGQATPRRPFCEQKCQVRVAGDSLVSTAVAARAAAGGGGAAALGAATLGGIAVATAGFIGCEGSGGKAAAVGPEDSAPLPWHWASDSCALWTRAWQADWDGRAPPPGALDEDGKQIKAQGRMRHLLFIRHGQYALDGDEHGLTELGREQSRLLAQRLAQMSGSLFKDDHAQYSVRFAGIWSSDVLRARQTAEIIAEHLPGVPLQPPDSVLAEGTPAVPCPQKGRGSVRASTLWEDSARIELAFRQYVHRDVDHKRLAEQASKERKKREKEQKKREKELEVKELEPPRSSDYHPAGKEPAAAASPSVQPEASRSPPEQPERTFEIVVGHCNVVRYFVMRALQLPPEAWLRLGGYNTSITEITVRPNGSVTLVRFGDTGHLPVEKTTFH